MPRDDDFGNGLWHWWLLRLDRAPQLLGGIFKNSGYSVGQPFFFKQIQMSRCGNKKAGIVDPFAEVVGGRYPAPAPRYRKAVWKQADGAAPQFGNIKSVQPPIGLERESNCCVQSHITGRRARTARNFRPTPTPARTSLFATFLSEGSAQATCSSAVTAHWAAGLS